jgi:hypothetical protein
MAYGGRAARLAAAIGLGLALVPRPAHAEEAKNADTDSNAEDSHTVDYFTPRYEPAGFPLIGGNSDIGFQFGGVATLTRFDGGARPYLWNMDAVLTASVKTGPDGTEIAQQYYLWQWDLPRMFGGKLRLTPLVYFQKTVNQPYFGPGNASSGARPATADGRYFQYRDNELRARQMARLAIGGPWELVALGTFRAESPGTYPGSQLERDVATRTADGAPLVRGVQQLGIGMLGTGFIHDSRDNEIFPHSGQFHQIGIRAALGLPTDSGVSYVGLGGSFSWVVPLGRDTVVAWRGVVDLLAGNVPFYDLFTGGPFQTYDMPGGPSGIRGVPSARYSGRVKAVANAELRSLPIGVRLFGQRFRLGGDLFADAGRTWIDYTFTNPLDGSGLGIKYGVGAGLYLLWGQAALFRLEVAYSPDQEAENPGFPVGIYVEDGVMF